MSLIDKALSALSANERDSYVYYLRQVVPNAPGAGGYGQYLGSIAPLIFATDAQKLEALRLTSEEEIS